MPKLPSRRVALSLESSLLSTFLKGSSFAALPLRAKEVDIPVFRTELPVGIIGVYGICGHTPDPYIHQLLMHTDTVFQTYALIECLERDVLDERDSVYLYVISLCTELDRSCLLAPYDRAYVMTVNTDNTVTDLPAFKGFLFLYKDLSDDRKPFLIILCICE